MNQLPAQMPHLSLRHLFLLPSDGKGNQMVFYDSEIACPDKMRQLRQLAH